MKALLSQLGVPTKHPQPQPLLCFSKIKARHLPTTPLTLGDLTDFGRGYRYSYMPPQLCRTGRKLIASVRILREHILARIATLSTTP